MRDSPLSVNTAERLANLALGCIHREYPNKLGHHVLQSDGDVKPPRQLTPAFYGCYDWHSAVHGHWMLARLARCFPDAPLASRARQALGRSLTAENLGCEADYMQNEGRASFERPYGLAWLLQLAAELAEWSDPDAGNWSAALKPLENVALERLEPWLVKLSHPVRSGEHSQSAFSLGLMLDYARSSRKPNFEKLLESKIQRFYWNDRGCPLNYEPSGEDFLSPCLAEADVMRRIQGSREFSAWLYGFAPGIPSDGRTWIEPAEPIDRSDGKLAHLDGLNLSRSWMLQGILTGLAPGDPRTASLEKTAAEHARAGLAAVTGEHYEGAHWIATFAVYLLTARGMRSSTMT